VAAALERRWEAARRARQTAEEAAPHRRQPPDTAQGARAPEWRAAFLDLGRTLPELGQTDVLAPAQRKAVLRWLLDTVVVPRRPRDEVQTRMVGQGGATPTCAGPVPVGACADRQGAAAMAQPMLPRCAVGHRDEALAAPRTQPGSRSPQRPPVWPRTVRTMRLQPGGLQQRQQSHRRQGAGGLTVPPRARRLGGSPHGLSDRRAHGRMQRAKAPATGLSLWPHEPTTGEHLQQWQAGTRTQGGVRAPTPDRHPPAQGGVL